MDMKKWNVNALKRCSSCKHWDYEHNTCLAQDILGCLEYDKCRCGDFNWSDEFIANLLNIPIDNAHSE